MMIRFALSIQLMTSVALFAFAQGEEPRPIQFRWTKGQVAKYKVEQSVQLAETSIDEKSRKPVLTTTTTKLQASKTWTVTEVDDAGVATLEMTITAMRQEINQATGDEKPMRNILDSTKPEDAQAMTFLNKPSVTIRVNPQGELIEAKSANDGVADRLKVELPFRVMLPKAAIKTGSNWQNKFVLKLPPPLGTGEKFDGIHKYSLKGFNGDVAVFGMKTELVKPLEDTGLMPAIMHSLWNGDVFVNTKLGTYAGAKLNIKKEIANYIGPGTKLSYENEYVEVVDTK